MADTRISKIQIRQGDFTDLPLLDSGELGYATDQHRLFIGNTIVDIGTGDGNVIEFFVPIALSNPNNIIAVLVDGNQVNTGDYTISGTGLTFATAPANGTAITAKYNSEIEIDRFSSVVPSLSLPANGNLAETGFSIDTTESDVVILDYTLSSTNGVRIGQLRFGTDTVNSTTTIDDNYTETGTIDIVFSVDIQTAGRLKLLYTDNDNLISKFKYTYKLWNSN